MAKRLVVDLPENCIGCELCILEIQRQLKKIGYEDSLIRVFVNDKKHLAENSKIRYFIDLDPKINNYEIEKIKGICPTQVFKVIEE